MEERLCPCCKKHYFEEKDAYEICPICGWEDDPVQRKDPYFKGGANEQCLKDAIIDYEMENESED